MSYGIHWFRRDLRIAGNPALRWSVEKHQGKVLGLFCFDKKFLSREDFSANRFQFFLETLRKLKTELRQAGGDLLFLDEGPTEAYASLFQKLKAKNQFPSSVSWNRDYEPFAVARDKKLNSWFESQKVEVHTERDHLVFEPHEIYKPGTPSEGYQVYTPFQRRFLDNLNTIEGQSRILVHKSGFTYLRKLEKEETKPVFHLTWDKVLATQSDEVFESYRKSNSQKVKISLPPAGSLAAFHRLKEVPKLLPDYGTSRDIPGLEGTSRLSIYFKNGSLTTSQVMYFLELGNLKGKLSGGEGKFLGELIWREFYYHVLFRHPRVEKENFLKQYDSLQWENREDYFEAWKEGLTGFPIVDAGMRELRETGWMHNRVRMIVASFLTKDLLVDWRWGEKYFMEHLLDGDLAPNNGGWQWGASTGCDPQPYFRIFNPELQSKRFDPDGNYIRRYIPELRKLDSKNIHNPAPLERGGYPMPIVDHSEQRDKALRLYSDCRQAK